jgi:hypothetical protein
VTNRRTRDWLDADFDPAAVARSELAWWVARRTPGENSPAQVGELIAAEYAVLYGVPRDAVRSSAMIRAEAARAARRRGRTPGLGAHWPHAPRVVH